MKLKFLGTGGGRYVTGYQNRQTGGIVVQTGDTQIHVDPGPGALYHCHEELDNPLDTEAVLVSHAHPDHSNDVEPLIGMMTQASDKPGAVFGSESVIHGYGEVEKAVSNYHKDLCMEVKVLEEDSKHEFKDLKIESQEMFHGDPKTQGFTLETEEKKIGFWTDTQYSDELTELYKGCDTLVIYCSRPRNEGIKGHTSLDEVPKIVEQTEVENIIITHFGQKFLNSDLEKQEEWLKEQVDAKVTFAEDGMQYPGNRSLGDF
ncbi:MBL fold metallo-hydrolase [Candidatus Nanohalobium constans]|uniref:Metal-dependent hydrolase, beta-lactamase superfamily n=1 Tax=Candidatus Nanohalobium constans TaxID=2565781 RepID=A0A5Q0UFI0_9ARCH|nr:MBL fold metallo-hydrolase [Candidatus Nanohalobium constans]QGA80284.1 metal-dependent hydrolase, beta-lactamase superfamily [Candidatus Nanohalobium constans]